MKRSQIPNALTVTRLVMTLAVLLTLDLADRLDQPTTLVLTALTLFVIAALTDALDGFLARRWNVISRFGRIVDPLADKLLILGTAGYLAAVDNFNTGLTAWMLAILLVRELLVTGLRGLVESSGHDFSAVASGKLKMILQSVAIPWAILGMAIDPAAASHTWFFLTRDILLHATALATLASGIPYVINAAIALRDAD
ncbi:CDP-diacylglycerol--glycerol-3-phosphate 3-phosphatidyltransferase [Mucisphaera calidilacus]|uniref:CDP-diacylglycerol--glycerol-3-phosphate 3-phosphatidyltransferase n=1 Tax=Mucisphaera calidilacus TaxID=2527982 RepID=A0A518BYP6_9BACT|nr:CDP-diacylglycerol--glycerol-3-phosphate 3-phosphatidyltransferase [Mucisphaera calidilacus]QDU72097.1 CDP-diacylglycerol--glycerol-3-phosphate 3-phosphatidyltransferase [Mucisphaera calidilacus]